MALYLPGKLKNIDDSIVDIHGTVADLLPYVINEAQDKLLHQYEPKRNIQRRWGVVQFLVYGLRAKDEKATNAVICFTRGEEADTKCDFCVNNSGDYTVFTKCIRLPKEFGSNCANSIYYPRGTVSMSKKQKPFDRIWSYIFKGDSWIYKVLSMSAPGPVPCLVGSDLQKVYDGKPNGAYIALLVNDWSGDVFYLRDEFLSLLKDHEVLEKGIIRLKDSDITLHIRDVLSSEEWVSIKDPSKLFDLDQKGSSLSTQVIYYTEDVLHTINQNQIGGTKGLSGKKEAVRHICSIKLKFRNGEPVTRVFEDPERKEREVRVVDIPTGEERKEWRIATPGEAERLYPDARP
jgi:hypothetical protein